MKPFYLCLFTSLLSLTLFAQKKTAPKPLPFIVKGQFTNSPENHVRIFFRDNNNQLIIDTIHLDKDGKFYLKTYHVAYPQQTSIQQNNIQVNNFFVAPGYNLTITGDAKDGKTLYLTTKITGTGAESNSYRQILDSILIARDDHTDYYNLPEAELLAYIKTSRALKDSVANVVFNQRRNKATAAKGRGKTGKIDGITRSLNTTAPTDKYMAYFKKMVDIENTFSDLYKLMLHADTHEYDYDKSVALINNNTDKAVLNNIFNPEYITSRYYTDFMASGYLRFWSRLDKLKDTTLLTHKDYPLEKVSATYKGPIKTYSIAAILDNRLYSVKTIKGLNDYKESAKPYLAELNGPMRNSILKRISETEISLFKTAIGKPAPKFTLTSNTGQSFNLDDFKGKVIYLDLWASWCVPCRNETPALKTLYAKYKNDPRVAIISIAVSDGVNEWKKAIKEDKPEWLQLLDKEGVVSKNYAAYEIPKFILINKQGNIVSFDAPRPSSPQKLEAFLLNEMDK